ncbi:MAG: hypothetical protein JNG88_03375 [Phycisphaerales bacterium]|nr:hypothetical protein [Phycisphaerales bacterium]
MQKPKRRAREQAARELLADDKRGTRPQWGGVGARGGGRRRGGLWPACLVGVVALFATGCTAESVRIAIEAQQRADSVQQAIFERQNDALRVLLYRDLLRRLAEAGAALDERQREVANAVWNDRDLLEFWTVQQERSRALRLIGVDSRLYSEQSIVDLLIKSITNKIDRIGEHMAARAGAGVGPASGESAKGEANGQ